MGSQLDRSKRNVSMKSIPVLTRDFKQQSSPTSDGSSKSPRDCFTTSSLVPSTSNSSVNSTASRSYPSTATERKNRLVSPSTSGTPEWFVKKIHDQTVSSKQLTTLQASLQGKDVEWVKRFVELGGMAVLARWLYHSNRKTFDTGVEFEVVKCLTYILNHRSATIIALAEGANETITHIASALDTPHLPTRRILLDILVFLVYWDDGANYQTVINGLESLSEDNDETGNAYAFWFKSLHTVLSGRGKMGSRVGASDQLKRSKGDPEALLTEYLMSNILLMNGIMQAIDDLDLRVHHRSQMETCGLQTIIKLARGCNIPVISTQLDLFQQTLEEDERSLLSIFQHLLLIRQDGLELARFLQVLDLIVADVVMDKKLGGAEKRLGLSVERIVGQLEQVERAQDIEDELVKTRTTALHLKIEKETLEDRLAHADGLAMALQNKLSKLQLENARLTGTKPNAASSPGDSSYADRLAQLADVLPGSPLALSYVPTSTPRPTPNANSNSHSNRSVKSSVPGRQPFWGISSWFGLREDESGSVANTSSTRTSVNPNSPLPLSLPSKTGLGITEMKEDLIVTANVGEKTSI